MICKEDNGVEGVQYVGGEGRREVRGRRPLCNNVSCMHVRTGGPRGVEDEENVLAVHGFTRAIGTNLQEASREAEARGCASRWVGSATIVR